MISPVFVGVAEASKVKDGRNKDTMTQKMASPHPDDSCVQALLYSYPPNHFLRGWKPPFIEQVMLSEKEVAFESEQCDCRTHR